MEAKPINIGRKMAASAAWTVGTRVAVRAIGLISTFILARLLLPEDFGLVTLAAAIVVALEIFSLFSFDFALIRDGKAERQLYDTAWTLGLIRGAILAGLLVLGAAPAAVFFHEPRLEAVVLFLAIGTVLDSLQNIGVVDFRKEMTFEREFRFQVAQKITGFVVTGCLAFLWRDYWALVCGILASHTAGLVLSYVLHPFRPRLSLSQWRPLVNFTKWLLVNNILNFVLNRADVFILGRMVSPHELGLYAVAREISNLPTTELMWPVQRALFPGFAKLAHDPLALARTYLDSAAVLLAIALPAAVGLALVADPLVRVTLGDKWLAVIPLLQILAVQGAVRLGGSLTIAALLAVGRPKLTTLIAVTTAAVQTPLLIVGALTGGVMGMAIASGVAAAINLVISLAVSLTALKISSPALLGAVWRTGVATLCMSGAAWGWIEGFAATAGLGDYPLLELFSGAAVGAIAYVAVHLLLWRLQGRVHGAERIILDAVMPGLGRHWRRWRGAPTA